MGHQFMMGDCRTGWVRLVSGQIPSSVIPKMSITFILNPILELEVNVQIFEQVLNMLMMEVVSL